MLGIPLGLAYSNAGEWLLHKYMLHGRGKDKRSFWSFHWHEHHREARKNEMYDPQYVRPVLSWSPQGKEVAALLFSAVTHLPLFPIAPFFVGTVLWSNWHYYQVHKKAHLDPQWARDNLPWHYDHHLGKDQNANWCVTHPWFDYVMGTRLKYSYGSDGKIRDQAQEAQPEPKGNLVRRLAARLWGAWKQSQAEKSIPAPRERSAVAA
jgi:sterol desaturase/sphingolipid hydroxylase (fatty acid hydroxylase superfamily)